MKKKKRWIVGLLAIGLLCKSPEPIQAETKWPEGISISSGSACVIEVNTGTVLYEKNATDKSYPASITKVLTVDVALENAASVAGFSSIEAHQRKAASLR